MYVTSMRNTLFLMNTPTNTTNAFIFKKTNQKKTYPNGGKKMKTETKEFFRLLASIEQERARTSKKVASIFITVMLILATFATFLEILP